MSSISNTLSLSSQQEPGTQHMGELGPGTLPRDDGIPAFRRLGINKQMQFQAVTSPDCLLQACCSRCLAWLHTSCWPGSGQSINHFNCFTDLLMSLHYHRGHDPSCTQQQKGKENQTTVVTDKTRVVKLEIADPRACMCKPI